MLVIPTGLTLMLMMNPGDFGYGWFLAVAVITGFGGGNFASSMTNINAFYPQRRLLGARPPTPAAATSEAGRAADRSAGDLASPPTTRRSCAPSIWCRFGDRRCGVRHAGGQPDHQTSSAKAMIDCLRYRDTWIIGILYVGTFGSFIGFGFAFSQVLNISFTSPRAAKALAAAQIAWIGPLLGSLARPYGGKLADKIGGGKVTMFVGMTAAAAILVAAGTMSDNNGKVTRPDTWWA